MVADEASCCNEEQQAFLYLYCIYLVGILLCRDSILLKPMRLLATSVHELSHAAMCWLTGGRILQLHVYENEGGATKYRGGWRCLIAPAGYLGEAIWGMILSICSGGRMTATVAALLLVLALIVSLCYGPNRIMVVLNLSYAAILLALVYIEWWVFSPILLYVTLLFGVFLSVSALSDIFSHLILRSRPGSDAYSLYEESGKCVPPRCIGIIWFTIAIVFQILGVLLVLILMCNTCREKGWFECVLRSRLYLQLETQAWDWWPDDWALMRRNP